MRAKPWLWIVVVILPLLLIFWGESDYFCSQALHLDRMLLGPAQFGPMGTDELGQDYSCQVSRAIGYSSLFALWALIIAATLTLSLLFVGWAWGRARRLILSLVQIWDIVPGFIWVGLVMASLGSLLNDIQRLILLGALVALQQFPRLYRFYLGFVDNWIRQPSVEGATAIGLGRYRIFFFHIMWPIWFQTYKAIPYFYFSFLVSEGFYTFLGLGVRPNFTTMGGLLIRGWKYFYQASHLFFIPLFIYFCFFLMLQLLHSHLENVD